MARKFSSFAYKIDYDKEISIDRSQLEAHERTLRVCKALPKSVADEMLAHLKYSMTHAEDLLLVAHLQHELDAVAGLLDIDPSLALDILFWSNPEELPSPIPQRSPGSYNRAEAATRALDWFRFDTEQEIRKRISETKATLSRHLRNKERHG